MNVAKGNKQQKEHTPMVETQTLALTDPTELQAAMSHY